MEKAGKGKGSSSFLKKKNQKTFICYGRHLIGSFERAAWRN
jgi:hypothetical protein